MSAIYLIRSRTLIACLTLVCAALPAPARPQERGPTISGAGGRQVSVGRYYALVIGNNVYRNLPRLTTAENDARAVAAILREQYGFETKILPNATREQIISAINNYRRTLDQSANLLIYYAGHGVNDKEIDKAYWLPVDAQGDFNANWISADDITSNIKGVPARHVLVVSDSCYSGTIYRDFTVNLSVPVERARFLESMLDSRSRTLMASGGDEPVVDGGGGGHSVFAKAFLRGLAQMGKDAFTGAELFRDYIQESVAGQSNQTPEYNPLRNSGHEHGDFVFVRQRAANRSASTNNGAGTPATPPAASGRADAGANTAPIFVAPTPSPRDDGEPPSPSPSTSFFPVRVRVRADNAANGWTDTGLMLRRGQFVRITATGRISLGGGRFSTPTGLPRVPDTERLMKGEPTGALIAVVGDDNNEFIFVGGAREFTASRDGRLFLGVNEGNLSDNTGIYDSLVEVAPLPASSSSEQPAGSGQVGLPWQLSSPNLIRVRADNAANGWTDTGLMVRRGQRINITATGRISLGGGRFSTPTGLPRVPDTEKLMRGEPTGALIAVVGGDNDEFIFVGSGREFTAPRDGRLFLGVNEGNLSDNTGTYEALIAIQPM